MPSNGAKSIFTRFFIATPPAAVGGSLASVYAYRLRRDKELVERSVCVPARQVEVVRRRLEAFEGMKHNLLFNATLAQLVEQRIRNA